MNMSTTRFANGCFIAVMFVFVVFVTSATAEQSGQSPDVNDVIVQKLNNTIADFNYDREDFSKIIDDLRDAV